MGGSAGKEKTHKLEIEKVLKEERVKLENAIKEKEEELNIERERAVQEKEEQLKAERERAVKQKEEQLNRERERAVKEKEEQLKAEQKRKEDEEKKEREAQPLQTPWRKTGFNLGEEINHSKKLTEEVRTFQIKLMKIKKGGQRNKETEAENGKTNMIAKILLLGPVGVGKSTFINSVLSISSGRLVHKAYAADANNESVTTKLFTFFGDDEIDNVRLLDTTGLMEETYLGFNVDDLIKLIDGRIKDGYKFKPNEPIDKKDPHYRHQRTIEDMVHCAVFVFDAINLKTYTKEYIDKIKCLQKKLVDEGVPRVVILTKCDELCPLVGSDVANIFRSRRTEDVVRMASSAFGIPKSYIHPIVNYGEGEIVIDPAINIPIMLAVRQMVQFAGDYLEIQSQKEAMKEVPQAVN